jgi:Rod binding domain-containing protein
MELPPIGSPARPAIPAAPTEAPAEAAARKAAEAFEAAFLSEMLKYTGLNANSESFGGGAGEDAFASFLTDEYARLLAERGGIGLAQQVFEVLKQRSRNA